MRNRSSKNCHGLSATLIAVVQAAALRQEIARIRRGSMRWIRWPHSGEVIAAANGVMPIRRPDHSRIAASSVTPMAGSRSGNTGGTMENAMPMTNCTANMASRVRCHPGACAS